MDILWAASDRELTGRDVADLIPENAYTTVATVLDRLVHKGLVHRRMEGRSIRFTAVGTSDAHTAVLMHEVLSASGRADSALAQFAETLSPSQAATLRRALEALDGESRTATG
jgi:predicted transcriptional regulator